MPKRNPERLLLATATNVRTIMEMYGVTVTRVETAASGIENQTLLVDTPNTQYVLRIYPQAAKTDDEIRLELDFMSMLRTHGLPVPRIISSLTHDSLVNIKLDGLQWQCILMERADGKHPDAYNRQLIDHMAKIQATMHNLGIAYAEHKNISPTRNVLNEACAVDSLLQNMAETHPHYQFLRRVKSFSLQLDHSLPTGVSHFDYDVDNLLADADSVTAVLDFGDVACMPVIICLGYTLWDVLFVHIGSIEYVQRYLKAYQTIRFLSRHEKALLSKIIMFRHYVIATLRMKFGDYGSTDFVEVIRQEAYINTLTF